ncbi:gastrula zinc finger protein XlCGF28.1-like [Anopheles ziemanni]|uniref:gastrula zinc finger protein XlCGF28.1-like n=1 Tax=Anopheles coustani TaxID=139045 RepID=UPI002658923F|nr:gastrula zinc finger protein XlCGF28.1-like [Anopheles coustani]XP_058170546.1 gastrula zinc finger protein XlCGF28.1-like [Anopheles ziemanni]
MAGEVLTQITIEDVCRFCLSKEQCVPLFVESFINDFLMEAIDLLLLKVDENDGLPNAVCEHCCRIMVEYAKFEAKAVESYRILAEALSDVGYIGTSPCDEMKTEAKVTEEYVALRCEDDVQDSTGSDCRVEKKLEVETTQQEKEQEDATTVQKNGLETNHQEPTHISNGNSKGGRSKKKCPVCGKLVSQLSKHMPVHSDTKKYTCEYCDKQFTYDTSLRKHLNIHRGIRKYFCQYCYQRFCDRSSLRYHEAKHLGERKYCCEECPSTFYTASQQKQHIRLAHREREFQCKQCGKMFPMKHHLDDHLLKHTEERPYGCTICGKKFKRRRHFLDHSVSHE